MADWNEIIVFVHGVVNKEGKQSHGSAFLNFCERVSRSFSKKKTIEKEIWSRQNTDNKICAEWGHEHKKASHKKDDIYLAAAQNKVAKEMWKAYNGNWVPRKSLGLLRNFFIYGIADMFYYVSEQGESTVKETVVGQIVTTLHDRKLINSDKPISITYIGHSAGTVILHDLLFALFYSGYKGDGITQSSTFKSLGRRDQSSKASSSSSVPLTEEQTYLKELRNMADAGQLRVRRFYTFGSPIAPLVFRRNKVIRNLASEEGGTDVLTPELIGITPDEQLDVHPRWVNFWHSVDIISYPIAYLYKNSANKIEDMLEKSFQWNPLKAHDVYWKSESVIKRIIKTF